MGICLALNLEKVGYDIVAVDKSVQRIAEINSRVIESPEPYVASYLKAAKHISASDDLNTILDQKVKLVFICVPTPSKVDGTFNHSYIDEVVDGLKALTKPTEPVELIINSTTMPGYCETLQKELSDYNYIISYNPEFIAQGNIIWDQQYPDQVLIGESNFNSGNCIAEIYLKMCPDLSENSINKMSCTSAEITKLAVNCMLTTRIAFANSIGDMASTYGAETNKILDAIGADKRIGKAYLKYGSGYGGPCLPRDNRALGKAAEKNGVELLIGKATDQSNQTHLAFQVAEILNQNEIKKQIVFDQVAYKSDTDILEESQQLALAVALMKAGKPVLIRETKMVIDQVKARYGNQFSYEIRDNE